MNTDVSTSGRIDRQVFDRMHTNAALGVHRGSSLQRKRTGEVAGVDVEHGHVAVVGDAAKHLLVGKISSYGGGRCREHGCVDIGSY